MNSRLHKAAQRYAQHGWHIFPCHPHAKTPATKNGCRDATTNPTTINNWWNENPNYNVAIATGHTSGIYAIDLDGPQGHTAYALLCHTHGQPHVPGALWQQTPTGGAHAIYTHPGGHLPNTTSWLATHVDTRGDGGYILASPSIHPNGGQYQWPHPCRIPPLPGWLLRLLRPLHRPAPPPDLSDAETRDRYTHTAIQNEVDAVANAPQGTRNNTLHRAAFNLGQLVGAGLANAEHVTNQLEQAAHTNGLTRDDGARATRKTITSGLTAGTANPRQKAS